MKVHLRRDPRRTRPTLCGAGNGSKHAQAVQSTPDFWRATCLRCLALRQMPTRR